MLNRDHDDGHEPGSLIGRAAPWLRGGRAWLGRLIGRRATTGVGHVSVGTFCHAAAGLRDAGLRRWSGPFDWIFSTPAMAAACLEDGFATLLDPAQLASVPPAELTNGAKRQCRHPAYEARYRLPIVFNHHDPARSPADMNRLRRGAARLLAALNGSGRNVCYLVSQVPWPEPEIDALAEALARFPSDNRLVVATITAGEGARSFRLAPRAGPGCHRYDLEIDTRTRSLGAAFPDPADNAHLAAALANVASRLEATFNGHN